MTKINHPFLLFVSILVCSFQVVAQCHSVPNNAVGWWDADNDSSTIAFDIRGGNHGQMLSGTAIDTGYVCDAFLLDGQSDYILIPHDDSLTFSNGVVDRPFSIETWVYFYDVTTSMIFAKGDDMEREYSFRMTGTSADYLAVGLYDDRRSTGGNFNVIGLRSTYNFHADENSWVHVAMTYDGSGMSSGITLYRNGVKLSTTVLVGTDSLGTYSAMRTTNNDAVIGRFFTDGNQYLDGKVDELSIYSRELSVSELLTIYNDGMDGKCSTPLDKDDTECHQDPSTSIVKIQAEHDFIKDYNNLIRDEIKIEFHENQSGNYKLFSSTGQVIIEGNYISTKVLNLNFSELNSGMYVFMITGKNSQVATLKLFVQK